MSKRSICKHGDLGCGGAPIYRTIDKGPYTIAEQEALWGRHLLRVGTGQHLYFCSCCTKDRIQHIIEETPV